MSKDRISARPVRIQSLGEEIANSVSHGIGLMIALAATPLLIITAVHEGDAAAVVGVSVFALSMMLMFLTSTVYHALPHNQAKRIFRILDHNAIFLLIAGTYTPFTLSVLEGAWGWTLFGLVWGLAAAGILLKSISGVKYHRLSIVIYLVMGWLVLIAIKPMWDSMPLPGLLWLLAGGLAYTGGVWFYRQKHRRYMHFVWHLFVIAGTSCHFIAVLNYGI